MYNICKFYSNSEKLDTQIPNRLWEADLVQVP